MAMRMPVFDPTINLGHVLTFLGFVATILFAFSSLDKRVTVQEQTTVYQQRKDAEQDRVILESKAEARDALKEVHTSLERLSDRIDARK